MYILSSPEALKTFLLNPRPYLLPPMPLPPCKVLVFGPPCSGRTTLCNLIAQKYKGKVGLCMSYVTRVSAGAWNQLSTFLLLLFINIQIANIWITEET